MIAAESILFTETAGTASMPTFNSDASALHGVVRLAGSPYEIGLQHGRVLGEHIRSLLQQPVESFEQSAENYFGPAELEQLRGIAEAAAVDVADLIAFNVRQFADAGGGGLHFALAAAANGKYDLLHGVNEDAQSGPADGERFLFVVEPADGIPYVTFGVAGQVGGLNGINARGLSVSTTALLDVENRPASIEGRLHSVLVKNILEGAADIDVATEIFKQDPGCIAYSLCLSHFPEDRLCHIEYDYHLLKVLPWTPDVISVNHRLMQTVPGEPPPISRQRFERLRELLRIETAAPVAPLDALVVLRDRFDPQQQRQLEQSTNATICRKDNQASILFHPAAASLWVSTDVKSNDVRDVYTHYDLRELLPGYACELTGEQARSDSIHRVSPVASRPAGPHECGHYEPATADDLLLIDAVPEHIPGQQLQAECHLDPTSDIFLLQHQFKNRPLMPLVCMVESLLEGASLLAGNDRRVTGIRDVEIANGLPFLTDVVQQAKVTATFADGEIETRLTCDMRNRSGEVLLKDKPHLSGTVQLEATESPGNCLAPSVPTRPDPNSTEWVRCFYTENIVIYHGPVFRCLRELAVDGDNAWGHIVPLPISRMQGPRAGNRWLTNLTLMDACLYACGSFLWLNHRGTIAIPDGIEQLRIGRLPRSGEQCLIAMADRGRREDRTYYDFSVYGENEDLLIDVRGYRNKIVAEEPPLPE